MPKYKCGHVAAGETRWRDITADNARSAAERYAEIRDAIERTHPPSSVITVVDSAGVAGFYEVLCIGLPVYRAVPVSLRSVIARQE
jgi:hypothetical protein